MANNIEVRYKKLTGIDPRKGLEPPLVGKDLVNALGKLKRHNGSSPNFPPVIKHVSIYETGTWPDGPFTILEATLTDGSTVGAYVFKPAPEPKKLLDFAKGLSPDEWFSFDPTNPSASGV